MWQFHTWQCPSLYMTEYFWQILEKYMEVFQAKSSASMMWTSRTRAKYVFGDMQYRCQFSPAISPWIPLAIGVYQKRRSTNHAKSVRVVSNRDRNTAPARFGNRQKFCSRSPQANVDCIDYGIYTMVHFHFCSTIRKLTSVFDPYQKYPLYIFWMLDATQLAWHSDRRVRVFSNFMLGFSA